MTTDRLDLSALRRAITSLEQSIAIISNEVWFQQQSDAMQNTLRAGAIQNFEFVYEISIKMIRRQLELEAASPADIDTSSFRDLMRRAGEKGLIDDVHAWFNYRHMRNLTAHTYDQAKAKEVYASSLTFADAARALLDALAARHDRG
ncbi:MAG: nucleotidyltransferase substrate binding protein [Xanthomonadales bacterium]|nr:nucleotidyltransferase substrate binding protein [Xanthomonadales bacterium]